MQYPATGSWRRKSDIPGNPDGGPGHDPAEPSTRANARRVEAWEAEGGSTGGVSSDILRILVVDNDMASADRLELMLHAAGYPETCVAYSAHAALAFAVEFRPDVAFLEMDLLDMESNELAQRLRERAQLHHLRLIAMTDSRRHDGRELARNAGFERYFLKPITVADLTSLLVTQDRAPPL